MFLEAGSRIDNIQFELNSVEIFFWLRFFLKCYLKKKNNICFDLLFEKKFRIGSGYYKNLKNLISKIFLKFGFYHPALFSNKPWVLYWLLNSIDIIYFNSKRDFFAKKIDALFLHLSRINLAEIVGNSPTSLFTLYSTILYSTLLPHENLQIFNRRSIKNVYYSIRLLTKNTILSKNSKISDCDSRNLFCILVISSLMNILTIEIENIFSGKIRHASITFEGFSMKRFGSAHGAITYCWLGSIFFLSKKNKIELSKEIKKWLSTRQSIFMFGFSGRMSKIPDSCYNFWIGAISVMLNINISEKLENSLIFFNDHILNSFSDRPGKTNDAYHICYAICGFAMLNFSNFSRQKLNFSERKIGQENGIFMNLGKLNPIFSLREARIIFIFSGKNKN